MLTSVLTQFFTCEPEYIKVCIFFECGGELLRDTHER